MHIQRQSRQGEPRGDANGRSQSVTDSDRKVNSVTDNKNLTNMQNEWLKDILIFPDLPKIADDTLNHGCEAPAKNSQIPLQYKFYIDIVETM